MRQSRTELVQAVNRVVNARSVEERTVAAEAMTASLQGFLQAEELVNVAPDASGAVARIRQELGEALAPVSGLTEAQLQEFNQLLPWAAMTVDQQGRILGAPWSAEKRAGVHSLIERRHVEFNESFPLRGKHVAELGCFEGIHTLGLLLLGARVTAIDGRVENVLKTLARLWAYGKSAEVVLWDFELSAPPHIAQSWDVLHHIGVLYHLARPVEHLNEVLPRTREALILDTHVATDQSEANQTYEVGGATFRYRKKGEPHADSSPFAGMRPHAKYLLLEELVGLIRANGFSDVRVVGDRIERHGRRVTIWGFR